MAFVTFKFRKKEYQVEKVAKLSKNNFYLVASSLEGGRRYNSAFVLNRKNDLRKPAWSAMGKFIGQERSYYAAQGKKAR